MFIIYDILFFLFALVYFPCFLVKGKGHRGFGMRCGLFPGHLRRALAQKKNIWIHAVSVGEVLAVSHLIQKLKEVFPEYSIVCSTVTKSGHQLAQTQLPDSCQVIYAPLDFSWVVKKYIHFVNPRLYIAMETEIWPNLYMFLRKKGIAIVQVNGRISDRSFAGYKKISFLTKRILDCVDAFCMQSPLDAERIVQLGAAADKTRVVGNLKFDSLPALTPVDQQDVGFHRQDELLIAGSTHPGEEGIMLGVYRQLTGEFPHLRLVIAPRHVERTEDILKEVEQEGSRALKFSEIKKDKGDQKTIVIVDAIGHLRMLYSLAKIVFIGKTLKVGGGQNVIEPLSFGKPTLVGPYTQNFKDVVHLFLKEGALIQVRDRQELLSQMRQLLKNPKKMETMGLSAREVIQKYQGATAKTIEIISKLLR